MTELVDAYLACWNETDAATRRSLVEQHFSARVTYTDPMAEAQGHDALDGLIGTVQQQFPGFVFTPGGVDDGHHRQARFTWGLGPDGADPVVRGFDVVVTDDDGRIEHVFGFLDQVPN